MTQKQKIIEELENYKEFFHIFSLSSENSEFMEEFRLNEILQDCIRMRNNKQRLLKEGII